MKLSKELATHLLQLCDGGNWTSVSLRSTLEPIDVNTALRKLNAVQHNSIAELTFHCHYYIAAARRVLEGQPLDAHDTLSFQCPEFQNDSQWHIVKHQLYADTHTLAGLIANLPEEQWSHDFVDAKFGSYYRNIQGTIEHTHYHLGQILLLSRILKHEQTQ